MQNVEQCYSCPDPSADKMEATSMLGHRSARDPYFTDTSGRSDAHRLGLASRNTVRFLITFFEVGRWHLAYNGY